MRFLVIASCVTGVVWVATRPLVPIRHEPGVLVAEAPVQSDLEGAGVGAAGGRGGGVIEVGGWELSPLAGYLAHARVLGKKRYRSDPPAEISPYDLLLGWGPMSDSAVLGTIDFSQYGRFGYWTFGAGCPLTEPEISLHVANTHIIPASEGVRDRIASLKVGSLVRLEGVLVEARHPDADRPWRSSLVRTDGGNGACEILYVESVITW